MRIWKFAPLAPKYGKESWLWCPTLLNKVQRTKQLSFHQIYTSVHVSLALPDTRGHGKTITAAHRVTRHCLHIADRSWLGVLKLPDCKSSQMRFSSLRRTQEKGASYIAKERAERMVVVAGMYFRRNPESWTCWIAGSGVTCCSCWSWWAWGVCCSPGLVGNVGGSDPGAGTSPLQAYLEGGTTDRMVITEIERFYSMNDNDVPCISVMLKTLFCTSDHLPSNHEPWSALKAFPECSAEMHFTYTQP